MAPARVAVRSPPVTPKVTFACDPLAVSTTGPLPVEPLDPLPVVTGPKVMAMSHGMSSGYDPMGMGVPAVLEATVIGIVIGVSVLALLLTT